MNNASFMDNTYCFYKIYDVFISKHFFFLNKNITVLEKQLMSNVKKNLLSFFKKCITINSVATIVKRIGIVNYFNGNFN